MPSTQSGIEINAVLKGLSRVSFEGSPGDNSLVTKANKASGAPCLVAKEHVHGDQIDQDCCTSGQAAAADQGPLRPGAAASQGRRPRMEDSHVIMEGLMSATGPPDYHQQQQHTTALLGVSMPPSTPPLCHFATCAEHSRLWQLGLWSSRHQMHQTDSCMQRISPQEANFVAAATRSLLQLVPPRPNTNTPVMAKQCAACGICRMCCAGV
jgi:hypothetical protein